MKLLLVFLMFMAGSVVRADPTPVSGTLELRHTQYYFTDSRHRSVKVLSFGRHIQEQLQRLESGDAIRGQAQFTNSQEMILYTIDFVGLQRLLGKWIGSGSFFEFKNFADVTYTLPNFQSASRTRSTYAITPSEGKNWKVFFSDNREVQLGTLKIFDNERVLIYFHDSETGQVNNVVNLTKLRKR